MSRIDYSDEEDRPGQFALSNANVTRSLHGNAGQAALRDLEAAPLALPEQRLIRDLLRDGDGGVCAIGCYAASKGLDLWKFDPEDKTDEVGIKAGMPRLVAWKVVALNDIEIDAYYVTAEGPSRYYSGMGVPLRIEFTPEERYERVLAWVRSHLYAAPER